MSSTPARWLPPWADPTSEAPIRRTTRRGALLLAGTVALAACADDDPGVDDADIDAPDVDDEDEDDDPVDLDDVEEDDDEVDADPDGDDPGVDGEAAEDDADVAALQSEASLDDRDEPSDGTGLTVTDVRVGAHDGFDRVTIEVTGDAQVGWFTSYSDEAILDGSGEEIDVAGDAVLNVPVRGVTLPPERDEDAEAAAWDGEPVAAPDDAAVVTEVHEGVIFEGQHQIFVGVDAEVPYRIERFDDPQRIVLDLVHD